MQAACTPFIVTRGPEDEERIAEDLRRHLAPLAGAQLLLQVVSEGGGTGYFGKRVRKVNVRT